MKPMPSLLVRIFLACALLSALAAPLQAQKHVRVFLLGGQSNMGGGNYMNSYAAPTDQQIWYRVSHIEPFQTAPATADQWTFLENLVPNTAYGLERHFAYAMREQFPGDIIAIVKCYRNGAGMGLWTDPAQGGWDWMTDRVEAVETDLAARRSAGTISGWSWEGFAWMQGESDAAYAVANAALYSNTKRNFHKLFIQVRELLGPDVPVVAGRIYKYDNRSYLDEGPWPSLLAMRHPQTHITQTVPNSAWVNTDDLPARDDDPHYWDYTEMGVRFGVAMRNLITGGSQPFRPFRASVAWTPGDPANADPKEWYEFTAAEEGLHVTPGDGQVTLDWDYPINPGATFTVYYGTSAGSLTQTVSGIAQNQATITGLVNGTPYYFAATTVTAGGESARSRTVSGTPAAAANAAPWVWLQDLKSYPGYKEWIHISDTLALEATVRDNDFAAMAYAWQQVSGPGTATFSAPGAMDTTVTFSAGGVYVLRFTANDGALSTVKEITVNVDANPIPAPVFTIGAGVSIPSTGTLVCDVTYSTLDVRPWATPRVYTWSKVSGPGAVTFQTNPAYPHQATASFSAVGDYVIRLSIDNGAAVGSATRAVTVFEKGQMNLALKKPATQSSIFASHRGPEKAVDGIISGDNSNVATTNNEAQPWWQVDLGADLVISRIKVYNRPGWEVATRNFYVLISDAPFGTRTLTELLADETIIKIGPTAQGLHPSIFDLPENTTGRYVRTQRTDTNYWETNEVQVFGPDTVAPTAPGAPAASAVEWNQLTLTWTAATDNDRVVNYIVYRDGVEVARTAALSATVTGLTGSTAYSFTVTALDAADLESPASAPLVVTTGPSPDSTPPSTPAGLAWRLSGGAVEIYWPESTDASGVQRYEVFKDGVSQGNTLTGSHLDFGLLPNVSYSFTVTAEDVFGNVSPPSEPLIVLLTGATYTLTYSAGPGGSISGVAVQVVLAGFSGGPVTAVPGSGYRFVQWSDGSTANPRTDANVQADITVSASFAANAAPAITEGDSISVTMSEDGAPTPFALTLHASDADDTTLSWSISAAATHGTAIASGTGASKAVSYIPAGNWHGSDSFGVRVLDPAGAPDTITVNVTVTPVNDTPVVANPIPDQAATAGTAFAYTVAGNAFTDADGDTLAYAATRADGSPLPAWLSFNPATRAFSGTPGTADAGTVSVRVTATDPGALSASDTFALAVAVPQASLLYYESFEGGAFVAGNDLDLDDADFTAASGTASDSPGAVGQTTRWHLRNQTGTYAADYRYTAKVGTAPMSYANGDVVVNGGSKNLLVRLNNTAGTLISIEVGTSVSPLTPAAVGAGKSVFMSVLMRAQAAAIPTTTPNGLLVTSTTGINSTTARRSEAGFIQNDACLGNTYSLGSNNFPYGTTHLVVAEFVSDGSVFATHRLWLNPASTTSAGAPLLTATSTVMTSIASVYAHVRNLVSVGDTVEFDEFRMGATWGDVVPGAGPTPLQLWYQSYGLPADGSGDGAPGADPDKDGVVNLLECAFGGSPVNPADAPAPQAGLAASRASITFPRARADLTYVVEGSGDLATWGTVATNPGSVGQTVTVEDTTNLQPGEPRFLRVRVAQP